MGDPIKVFLSPSTQDWNPYAGGGNEEFEMRLVCAAAALALDRSGVAVKVGGKVSASANVKEGNLYNPDYYVAVHSNAGGGDGTLALYHSRNLVGKRLAETLYEDMAKISPGKDDGVRAGDKYIEINGPKATSALIEVEFHDSLQGANWIKENETLIGETIAKSILRFLGKAYVPADGATPPAVTPKPPVVPPIVPNYPVLKKGDKGLAVKTAQTLLNKHGAKLVVDGDFGAKTESAVIAFQKAHKLTADGIIGKNTWAELRKTSQTIPTSPAPKRTGVVIARSGLKVRTGPATTYRVIGALPYGTRVTIITNDHGWLKINYGTGFGWVAATYVKE